MVSCSSCLRPQGRTETLGAKPRCQSVLAPSLWWILPIPLAEQWHKLPKISPDHRSDEQVAKWTESRPVGAVGLYVDDILAGAAKSICQGLTDDMGPEDPQTIRFLGMNLDYISKKQSNSDQQEGGVTIN
eukprot:6487756-Amphidinium_carterae.1